MTMLFMDGADMGDFAYKYDGFNANLTVSTTTRYGLGQALYQGTSISAGALNFRKTIVPATKVVVGFAYRTAVINEGVAVVQFSADNNTIVHGSVRQMASGALALYRGTTQVAISAAGIFPINTWGYIELSGTVHDTTGYLEARLNGVTVCSFTGDTRNAGVSMLIDTVTWIYPNNGALSLTDDIYILNGLGSVNNDFLGERRVQTLRPNGAGSKAELSPMGSANNWENVDELPITSADYNYSSTAGQQDLYAMTELLAGTTVVNAVQSTAYVRKTDTGARSAKSLIRSNGTTGAGPTVALSPTLGVASQLAEADPGTGLAWVPGDFAALEAGVEVV